jgi:hypothetical protein
MNSKRKYVIAFVEGESANTHFCSLSELLEDNGWEYRYAIWENIDAVLDLRAGDHLIMNFNRDSEATGVIKRTL